MKINGEYVQFSKLFTTVVGLSYFIQVIVTMILVCKCEYASSALLDILKTTTGLCGLTFGCYSGNSVAEKYIRKSANLTESGEG